MSHRYVSSALPSKRFLLEEDYAHYGHVEGRKLLDKNALFYSDRDVHLKELNQILDLDVTWNKTLADASLTATNMIDELVGGGKDLIRQKRDRATSGLLLHRDTKLLPLKKKSHGVPLEKKAQLLEMPRILYEAALLEEKIDEEKVKALEQHL